MNNERMIEIIKRKTSIPLDGESWDEINEAYNMAIKALEERPRGEWIEHYDSADGFTWLTCSRCMFKANAEDYNFCPYCGADMQGDTNESD